MQRRHWLMAGVAGLAAAAGAGLAWHRTRLADADRAAAQALWALRLPRPEGGELALAGFQGKPLVLNFWATWCEPCVRELPALNRFHREFQARGWQVLALAVDSPTPVRSFLAEKPLGFPVALAGLDGHELMRTLGNVQGALPFSVVFSGDGRITQRKLGETRFEELQAWAAAA
jgi:peroxiredoxin